jgi:hypothetical protein
MPGKFTKVLVGACWVGIGLSGVPLYCNDGRGKAARPVYFSLAAAAR